MYLYSRKPMKPCAIVSFFIAAQPVYTSGKDDEAGDHEGEVMNGREEKSWMRRMRRMTDDG